ncbi:MAG: 16S rRNA (uracil(1498)-N(3))-methyltransferase [Clostridium sp.]|nr:16S rRNA (uracil(1498)-N(3))-methyltransferase [Clostridium sp.]
MKEVHVFYAPDVAPIQELIPDEAAHCGRVLRMKPGDEIRLTDGRGSFYKAELMEVSGKRCVYRVMSQMEEPRRWAARLHLAVAPTKNMDRIEWLAEKATEIGFDELSFVRCRYSERTVLKDERIDKILVSAMKQSHKAEKPQLNSLEAFRDFVKRPFVGQKFIAHCYDESDILGEERVKAEGEMEHGKPFLADVLERGGDALVMIGPEGDFSVDEVQMALSCGFRSVSLGSSRLRTETAALVAVHLMHLANRM